VAHAIAESLLRIIWVVASAVVTALRALQTQSAVPDLGVVLCVLITMDAMAERVVKFWVMVIVVLLYLRLRLQPQL
jgi:hypothetical protein